MYTNCETPTQRDSFRLHSSTFPYLFHIYSQIKFLFVSLRNEAIVGTNHSDRALLKVLQALEYSSVPSELCRQNEAIHGVLSERVFIDLQFFQKENSPSTWAEILDERTF